jgi:hypothetical protein
VKTAATIAHPCEGSVSVARSQGKRIRGISEAGLLRCLTITPAKGRKRQPPRAMLPLLSSRLVRDSGIVFQGVQNLGHLCRERETLMAPEIPL